MAILRSKEDVMLDVDKGVGTTSRGGQLTEDVVDAAWWARPARTEDELAPTPATASDENGRGGGDDGPRRDDEGGTGGGGGSRLQKVRREGKLDLRNGWQVVAGSILIPLGVVLILIAWYGSAHARVVQQQIPYLVSGSFVGLGFMVVGGFLFFGHWLYRMYDQAELHHEEQLRALQAIAAGAAWQAGLGPGAAGLAPGGVPAVGPGGPSSYYATATGTVYHRADCAVIVHHPDDLRVLRADDVAHLLPCQICAPD
jgi:hypothetical protein